MRGSCKTCCVVCTKGREGYNEWARYIVMVHALKEGKITMSVAYTKEWEDYKSCL